jgi:ribosomal-protein-alanine N-acetyltransferase
MFSFTPFPILATDRLLLRSFDSGDVDDVYAMRRDPRMCEHVDMLPDERPADTLAYLDKMRNGVAAGRWIVWAIALKSSGRVIGSVSLWNLDRERDYGELGYGVHPSFQGRGYMSEALARVVAYGFSEMGLARIEAYTEERNTPSVHLLERLGFALAERVEEAGVKVDRVFRMAVYRRDRPVD